MFVKTVYHCYRYYLTLSIPETGLLVVEATGVVVVGFEVVMEVVGVVFVVAGPQPAGM